MTEEEQAAMMQKMVQQQQAAAGAGEANSATPNAADGFDENNPETWGNPARNDACPCGSGQKFKHCHGKL